MVINLKSNSLLLNILRVSLPILIVIYSGTCYAQIPEIEWEHGYGGNLDDRGQCIIKGNVNGYIVAGYSNSIDGDIDDNHGGTDISVFKISEEGEIEWVHNYGGSELDRCYAIIPALDEGYILVGNTRSSDGNFSNNYGETDLCIIKIDESGNLLWSKTYGGSGGEGASKIISTIDSNYIIVGSSSSSDYDVTGNHGSDDYWILKINPVGEILWQKNYGSSDYDIAYDIFELSGSYIILGYAGSGDENVSVNYGGPDFWLIKIDQNGELIFEKSYGGSFTDVGHSLIMKDSYIYCVGVTYSDDYDITSSHGNSDCWALKIDSLGGLINQKTFGGSGFDEIRNFIIMDTVFVLVGGSNSSDGDITVNNGLGDYLFFAMDSSLNLQWQKTLGGSVSDLAFSVVASEDNAFTALGYALSNDFDVTETYDSYNFWAVKMKICSERYFVDIDGDGFGSSLNDSIACEIPFGYVTDSTDCNDGSNLIYPSAEDICNAIDDNCNGEIDEEAEFYNWYLDFDNDNYGNIEIDSNSCFTVEGYVLDSADCVDTDPSIYPGATEILNGLDDDCDGLTDENLAVNNELIEAFKIYPNPVENILHIDYDQNDAVKIEIVNTIGQSIYTTKLLSFPTDIQVDKYVPGIYLLNIKVAGEEISIPFVKESY